MMSRLNLLFGLISLSFLSCVDVPKDNSSTNPKIKEEYYPSGKIKYRAELRDGIEEGNIYKFYENQNLELVGIKIDGLKNGLWKYFNPDGSIKKAIHYFNDSLVCNLDVEDFDFIKERMDENLIPLCEGCAFGVI